jgi:hypothetical protein
MNSQVSISCDGIRLHMMSNFVNEMTNSPPHLVLDLTAWELDRVVVSWVMLMATQMRPNVWWARSDGCRLVHVVWLFSKPQRCHGGICCRKQVQVLVAGPSEVCGFIVGFLSAE